MHLIDTLSHLSLLDLVFECHFDELLVILVVILGELLFVVLLSCEVYFGLVETDQLLAQLLWLFAVDKFVVKEVDSRMYVVSGAIISLPSDLLSLMIILSALIVFVLFEYFIFIIGGIFHSLFAC